MCIRVRVCCVWVDQGPFHPPKAVGLNAERRFSKTRRIERELSPERREKQSTVKGKEAEWIGWKYDGVGSGLKAWRGCLWVPPTNHFSNRLHLLSFWLTFQASYRDGPSGRDTAAISAVAKGNANLIFRICILRFYMIGTEWRTPFDGMQYARYNEYIDVDSMRILRYYEYTISRMTARFQALILLANTRTKITV